MNTNDGVCLHINYGTGQFSEFTEILRISGLHIFVMEKEASLVKPDVNDIKLRENERHVESIEKHGVHKC
jgi:hypothetical protein